MATDAEDKAVIVELKGRARDCAVTSGLLDKVGAILVVVIAGLAQGLKIQVALGTIIT